jgi:hypothetical protein
MQMPHQRNRRRCGIIVAGRGRKSSASAAHAAPATPRPRAFAVDKAKEGIINSLEAAPCA